MSETARPPARQWKRRLLMTVAVILICLILLVAGAAIYITSPQFGHTATGWISTRTGRETSMEGGLQFHFGRYTRIIANKVRIANADWAEAPDFFTADKIDLTVDVAELLRFRLRIPELTADSPHLALEKNAEGKNNWSLTQNPSAAALKVPAPEDRGEFPWIGRVRIHDGQLSYNDPKDKIDTVVKVSTLKADEEDEKSTGSLQVEGKGRFQGKPFTLSMTGGPVLDLRDSSEPYPFSLEVGIGPTHAGAKGTVEDPVTLTGLDITLEVKGNNAADLFPITGIALPPSPPYRLTGHLTREEAKGQDGKSASIWHFTDFKGTLGTSDLSGDIDWHTDQEPPYFKGDFTSNNLDMKDLGGFVGADKPAANPDRVIPDKPLDITRLMAMNADATFKARHIRTPDLLDDFSMKLKLDNGTLTVDPFSFGIASGRINGDVKIEGKANPPVVNANILFHRLSLNGLFASLARKYGEENVSAGLLGGRAKLRGTGKSLHSVLSNANGSIGFGMEGGSLSRILLELAGLDFFRLAGLVVTGDKPVAIHCVVGDFAVENGMMATQQLLADSDVTTIEGEGSLNLKDEGLDFRLVVHPKDPSLFSARTPIVLGGTLKHPSVGVDPAALAARGGIAAALGALLTPVGALLAFIEPGLGEDSACAGFLRRVDRQTGGAVPKGK